MRDKTDETRQAVSRYDEFEFIPLRLEDAFDSGWWHRVGGSHNFTSIVDTTNEGGLRSIVFRLSTAELP